MICWTTNRRHDMCKFICENSHVMRQSHDDDFQPGRLKIGHVMCQSHYDDFQPGRLKFGHVMRQSHDDDFQQNWSRNAPVI